MGTFLTRLSLIIDEQENGKHTVFAKKAGIRPGTFQNYINGRKPSYDTLLNICETYNVNLNWLLTGKGTKYLTEAAETQLLDPDPEISELMEGAMRILTSGNTIACDALAQNIRCFDQTIAVEKRADESEQEIKEMKDKMEFLMEEFRKLKIENQRLDEEEEVPSSDEKAA